MCSDAQQQKGWWGDVSARPTQLSQCRVEDYPAGLHWLHYRYPPDFLHPDDVCIADT